MDTDLCDSRCRVVGTKQLLKKLALDEVSVLYLAKDAQKKIKDQLLPAARGKDVSIVEVESMDALGKMCGIAVGSAAAGRLRQAQA